MQEKQLVFGPTLTLILPLFGEHKKGKLYILKKVGNNFGSNFVCIYSFKSSHQAYSLKKGVLKNFSKISKNNFLTEPL